MSIEDKTRSDKYLKARKRVEEIKGFYIHLIVYIIVNVFISSAKVIVNMQDGETFSEAFFDFGTFAVWLFWGIGIFFHGIGVLNINLLFGKKWEEKKLKQFIEEDREQSKKILNK